MAASRGTSKTSTLMGESFFPSLQSFRDLLIRYQRSSGTAFAIHNCRRLGIGKPEIDNGLATSCKYSWVRFDCVHNKKIKKPTTQSTKKRYDHLGCPATISLVFDSKRSCLRLQSMNLTHNHTLSPEFPEQYAMNRRLNKEQKNEMFTLLSSFQSIQDIKRHIHDKYGINLTSKDVENLRTAMRKSENSEKSQMPTPIFQPHIVDNVPHPNGDGQVTELSQSTGGTHAIQLIYPVGGINAIEASHASGSVNLCEPPQPITSVSMIKTSNLSSVENAIETSTDVGRNITEASHSIVTINLTEDSQPNGNENATDARQLLDEIYKFLIRLDGNKYKNAKSSLRSLFEDLKANMLGVGPGNHTAPGFGVRHSLSTVYLSDVPSTSTIPPPICHTNSTWEGFQEEAITFMRYPMASQRKSILAVPVKSDVRRVGRQLTPAPWVPSTVDLVGLKFKSIGSRKPIRDCRTKNSAVCASVKCKQRNCGKDRYTPYQHNEPINWLKCDNCNNRLHRECVQVFRRMFTCPVCFCECSIY